MEFNKKNVRTVMFLIIFAVVVYALVHNLGVIYGAVRSVWTVMSTVTAGLMIAFVLNVPLRAFENRVFSSWRRGASPVARRLVRPVSLLCSVLVAFGIIAILLIVIIPQLSKTIAELPEMLAEYITVAIAWFNGLLASLNLSTDTLSNLTVDWQSALDDTVDFLKQGAGGFIGTAGSVGASVVSGAVDVVFSIIIALYVLAKKEAIGSFFKRMVTALLPEKISYQLLRVARMADETFSNFISGQLVDSGILGILCYIGMRIFRFPHPEIIAVVICVTSLVPMVGSLIGEIVGAFLILFESPIKALLFIIFILCLQQLEGSFIYPKVVGKSVGLPGVIVLCAVIVGSNAFGVMGALLSVPVCAILYALLRELIEAAEKTGAPPKLRREE